MGVHGLWRLIEPSGKPVPLESLENKVLAVDISIWIHQAIKGFQDSRGQPVANAHLLTLYHRICKLLYFKIRPVFVFDGGVPALKKRVIAIRSQNRIQKINEANDVHKQLIKTLLKHSAVNKILSENTKAKISSTNLSIKRKDDELYKLPPPNVTETVASLSEEEEEETTQSDTDSSSPVKWDLYSIQENSTQFKSLPIELRHEILSELKDTRKQSSWGKIHEMPQHSDGFSGYQMRRLLKRHSVQASLEEIEKEMGGHAMSLGEIESILNDQGVITTKQGGQHIASDENTRYFLIKDVQKAIDNAKKIAEKSNESEIAANDIELDRDLKKAIELSLQDVPSTSSNKSQDFESDAFDIEKFKDQDFESDSESDGEQNVLVAARNYMIEHSGLSPNEIAKILENQLPKRKRKLLIDTRSALNECSSTKKPQLKNLINKDQSTDEEVNIVEEVSVEFVEKSVIEPAKESVNKPVEESVNKTMQESVEKSVSQLMEESDSDSDDFVEVNVAEEVASPLKIISNATKNINGDKPLEIVINPDENIDDNDIFADVFKEGPHLLPNSNSTNKSVASTSSIVETVTTAGKSTEFHKTPALNESDLTEGVPSKSTVQETLEVESKELANLSQDHHSVLPDRTAEIKETINNLLEEHAKEINIKDKETITLEQLQLINDNLEAQKNELLTEHNVKSRLSNNITDQMYQEAQELLELFGIPYVIAPMEAEAQCAFLNEVNLTDGTITEDSDIWLFGGKIVYKNFFNQEKIVKEFRADNIQSIFKLNREQLILLALLVGSDYTTGIQGIGPVTALEILAAFPPKKQQELLSGLQEFQAWLLEGKKIGPGRTSLRSKLKNVEIKEGFPNIQIIQAYLEPTIDKSKEEFSWGKPDTFALIEYAKKKFGWTKIKSEEILKPILKRMKENLSQKTIKDYFKIKHKIDNKEFDAMISKRVKKAVERIGKGKTDSSDEELKILKETKTRSKKKVKEIEKEVKEKVDVPQSKRAVNLHNKKDFIPQKEKEKANLLRTKLKAIVVFRKSKQGPGYTQKRKKLVRQPKEDAELSESSSSD